MKKVLLLLCFFIGLMLLAGCEPPPPRLEDRVTEMPPEFVSQYTGVIENFPIDLYLEGTHQLKTDEGKVIVIQSPKINLNNYLGKKVIVKGSARKGIDSKSEVFTVEKIKLSFGESEAMTDYTSEKYGFSFRYPNTWELMEGGEKITFRGNGVSRVTLEALPADSDLDTFARGKEAEDGTPITVGAARSLRFISPTEIRIYIPNVTRKKVYKFTFSDQGEEKETQKKLFYSLLESFSVHEGEISQGEKCGGVDNLTCPDQYFCELQSGEADAEGVCVSVAQAESDKDCPYAAIPKECPNAYQPVSFNKAGCPTSYKCEGGRF